MYFPFTDARWMYYVLLADLSLDLEDSKAWSKHLRYVERNFVLLSELCIILDRGN